MTEQERHHDGRQDLGGCDGGGDDGGLDGVRSRLDDLVDVGLAATRRAAARGNSEEFLGMVRQEVGQ